jgi:hypothetical protein
MNTRMQSWWDLNVFTLRTLRPPRKSVVIASTILMMVGIALWVSDLLAGAWVAVIVGFLGIGKDVAAITIRWFTSPQGRLVKDISADELLSNVRLTADYKTQGYEIAKVPNYSDEYVVRSQDVDSFVRNNDVALRVNQELIEPVNEALRARAAVMEDALRFQYRESWGAYPARRFVNEVKTCLGQDVVANQAFIDIYRGSYFHSFLTNELVTRNVESIGSGPVHGYHGTKSFPVYPQSRELKRIRESKMGNHIGISTIIHTGDGQLVLWRQSAAAQQSREHLAPTGSGSCDWSDWEDLTGERLLKDLIARAMERELCEESHPLKSALSNVAMKTAILGHYRWVRRGGKPEFVGLTKALIDSSMLKPNVQEVDAPEFIRLVYPASTLDELRKSISELLLHKALSVPLWVNLMCLDEALRADTSKWAKYLGLRDVQSVEQCNRA